MDARGGGGEVGGAGHLSTPREVGSAKLEAGSEVGEVVAVDPAGGCGGRSGEVAGVEGQRSGGKIQELVARGKQIRNAGEEAERRHLAAVAELVAEASPEEGPICKVSLGAIFVFRKSPWCSAVGVDSSL